MRDDRKSEGEEVVSSRGKERNEGRSLQGEERERAHLSGLRPDRATKKARY